ncbi:MAG TPA: glycoside hydrolase family 2 TIM barrel-domain containing protein [Saprospiraceae bacterium]|nr:glycoside hydrolase family 2 TIM barrel-domain containing protein [Saprospiraceae bacterium]HMQ81440.1 glycoside hydrolase family 2 TIM barrel-domain containing protein [Saprospiraceae bacterium]
MRIFLTYFILMGITWGVVAQKPYPLIQGAYMRSSHSLSGQWHYIIDPYDTGYRDHRTWIPFDEKESSKASAKPYWTNSKPQNISDRIEYDFDTAPTIQVPGDWNTQQAELLYYEGAMWYKTSFQQLSSAQERLFLYFGAANYQADVYLNGKKVGQHRGGFDPFNFEITDQIQQGDNALIVRVDNRRESDRVPNMTTDWWNYGGLTRDVALLVLPKTFIRDYKLQLDPRHPDRLMGFVQLDGSQSEQEVQISIPEAHFSQLIRTDAKGYAPLDFTDPGLLRWYPERPKLYDVVINTSQDTISDRIGFRTIEARGEDILLNGKSIFLRGISLHEEAPFGRGRAHSREDMATLFGWAAELHCNMIRLAHYPHNEHAPRLADEMGFLLWEEVPVYWGINYTDSIAYQDAENQLRTLIERDKNRASVIVWSVANETPRHDENRLIFLNKLASVARSLDNHRLISAALDRDEDKARKRVTTSDPFAQNADMISINEYIGWYGSTPDLCAQMTWDMSTHNKPFFISEFGAGALYNYHGPKELLWTEDYQAWMYEESLLMLHKIPSLRGMTPWILVDFRSPRRNLSGIQDGWNRKGVISDNGQKKMAFEVLKAFYKEIEKKYTYTLD